MIRCPAFEFRAPTSVEEAVRVLHAEGPGAVILAGGTDLLPAMKRRTQTPRVLVSLRRVAGLRQLTTDGTRTAVGAARTLAEVAADPGLRPFAALQRAAARVATPPIRNTATVGGNLCLPTRCNYYDQSHEWREAIGFCLRSEGPEGSDRARCWVAPEGRRCWAVSSTDLAPALIALGAEVTLVSDAGARCIPLEGLYADDGAAHLARRPDELLTEVRLDDRARSDRFRSTYWKLGRREAFDFPLLGVAAAVERDAAGAVLAARLVLGAVASRPVLVEAAGQLVGRPLDDAAIEELADAAARLAKPLDNADLPLGWRKRVTTALVAGALRELRGDDPRTLGPLARHASGLRSAGAGVRVAK